MTPQDKATKLQARATQAQAVIDRKTRRLQLAIDIATHKANKLKFKDERLILKNERCLQALAVMMAKSNVYSSDAQAKHISILRRSLANNADDVAMAQARQLERTMLEAATLAAQGY